MPNKIESVGRESASAVAEDAGSVAGPGPDVSIITVSYNSAATIRDTIESVLAQDYPGIEYIIVDGGSTDGTVEIVREYGARINQFISEPDRGIYDAMNKGIRLARGGVVGFLNSDDFYTGPSSVRRAMSALEEDGVDASYGDLCYVAAGDTDRVVRYWRSSPFRPGLFRTGWCPPHPTLFVRRQVYAQCGGFDLSYRLAADAELMMRLFEVHAIRTAYVPEPLVHMRLGGETNRSLGNILRQNREIWGALRQHDLRPSLFGFVAGKVLSRVTQFIRKPA